MKKEWQGDLLRMAAVIAVLLGSMGRDSLGKCYYIDAANGSDDGTGASPSLAWKTLAFASGNDFKPGDSLLLKRGCQWTEGFAGYSGGAPQQPFYIGAYGSGTAPVINDSTDKNGYGIELFAPWVIVENLSVKNGLNGGIFITQDADSCIVRNCEVTASGTGVEVQGRYNLVQGNYLHDLTMILNEPGNEGDYGAVGVTVESACNEVCYNRMIRCIAPCYEGGTDGGVVELYGTTDSCLIHHNLGVGCAGFVEVGGGSAINTRIYYNILINNGTVMCIHLNDQFASTVQNLRMENNTILDTLTGETPNWDLIDFIGTPTPSTFLFRNNIVFVKNFSTIVNVTDANSGWSFTHTHNLYHLDSSIVKLNMTLDSGEAEANPLFVNYADTNLHLQSNSPAVADGLPLGYLLDFYNIAVPTIPSLGAVQYVATIGTPPLVPVAPVLASPANGVGSQPLSVELSWATSIGATAYEVEVSLSSTFGTTLFDQSGATLTSVTVSGLTNGMACNWRVDASNSSGMNWSAFWSFTTIPAAPAAPSLAAPAMKTTGEASSLTLSWTSASGAASYTVLVSTGSTFAGTIYSRTGTGLSASVSGLAYGGIPYYWQVGATNPAGTVWSTVWSFTTLSPPAPPTPVSPDDMAKCTNGQPITIIWATAATATSYTVQIATNSSFASTSFSQSGTRGFCQFTPDCGGLTYWQVNATNAAGTGAWSDIWNFTVDVATATLLNKVLTPPSFSMRNGVIAYFLNQQCPVNISIYDMLGKKVFEFKRLQSSGSYSISTKNLKLSSALYLVHFKAGTMEGTGTVLGR